MDGAASGIVDGGPIADLGGLERWYNNPGIAVWSFLFVGCFLLNATLLLAFLARPGLRTISNRFVMNLAVSNLLTCTVLSVLLITYSAGITPASVSTVNICAVSEGATALVTTSSVLSVLLIAVDQYFAVVDPLRYRARVDKFKPAVLIVTVWLVSAAFGMIASLNPRPRSFWSSCATLNGTLDREDASAAEWSIESFALLRNWSMEVEETREMRRDVAGVAETTTIEPIGIGRDAASALDNSTVVLRALAGDDSYVTYGLVYALVHSMLAYLLPFAGICWIYVSIYSAAHRNSERTRRTGSRPILAPSASFCEDPCASCARSQHPDTFADEFRRIPKISSLSSIDETSETAAHSASRGRSFSSSSDVAGQTLPSPPPPPPPPPASDLEGGAPSAGVVFTVGLRPVEVSAPRDVAVTSSYSPPADRRSSRDPTYDPESAGWLAGADTSESESEDERRYGCFDSLEVPGGGLRAGRRASRRYFLPLGGHEAIMESPGPSYVERTECSRTDDDDEDEDDDDDDPTGQGRARSARPSLLNCAGDNSDSRRSRRSSRRSSRSGVSDAGAGESQPLGGCSSPSSCLLTPIVTITPAPNRPHCNLSRAPSGRSTGGYINSLKHRISNGSLFRYREETRAARISALVIVMGLLCWSPYMVLNVIKNLPQSDRELPHTYDVTALCLLILAAYVSPLLFGYRSRRVKRELRRFFCFRRELSYKNNRSLMAKKVLKRRHSSTLSHLELDHKYNIFSCVYGRGKWPKEKVQFVQVSDTALAVETCRSSFSSGASTQISSTSTEEC